MPVWFSTTSFRVCAQMVGNPVMAPVEAAAAPAAATPFKTLRRETFF